VWSGDEAAGDEPEPMRVEPKSRLETQKTGIRLTAACGGLSFSVLERKIHMATNDEPQMAERSKVNVNFDDELELNVNAATLELLQRRIESQVMTNILKMVGIPVAGGGIFAVAIAAFLWIPSQVKTVIEDNETVKKYVSDSVQNYLEKDGQGKLFLTRQIETSVASYFAEGAGKEELKKQLQAQLTKDEIKAILKDTVSKELRTIAKNATGQISDNLQKHIATTTEPATASEKGGYRQLSIFLDSKEAKEAGEQGRPLFLGFNVGKSSYYQPTAIGHYVREIKAAFPKSDVYFLLKQDRENTFVALCGPVVSAPDSEEHFKRLVGMIEKPWMDLETAHSAVRELKNFSTVITSQLPETESLEAAMRSNVWSNPDKLQEKAAVVNSKGLFIGTTSREQIIEALLKI
jgi:hypothetical protein